MPKTRPMMLHTPTTLSGRTPDRLPLIRKGGRTRPRSRSAVYAAAHAWTRNSSWRLFPPIRLSIHQTAIDDMTGLIGQEFFRCQSLASGGHPPHHAVRTANVEKDRGHEFLCRRPVPRLPDESPALDAESKRRATTPPPTRVADRALHSSPGEVVAGHPGRGARLSTGPTCGLHHSFTSLKSP